MPTYTVPQFAQSIRKKYPGAYDKVSDDQLVQAWVKKYPVYHAQIDFGSAKTPAAASTPDWQPADTKAPTNARFPALGRGGYKAADVFAKLLPGLGATAGGMAGSGVATIPGAAAGAVVGSDAERFLQNMMYKDLPKETAGVAAKDLAVQATMGAGSEAGAGVASRLLSRIAKPFEKSAQTLEEAKAGTGVRLTPGEASGSRLMQLGESVLEHAPGSSGVLHGYRTAQEGEAAQLLDRTLNDISQRTLTPEETGKAVQKAISDFKGQATRDINEKYDAVRQMLGKKPGEYMSPEDFDRAIAAEEKKTILDPSGKPIPSATAKAARTKLEEARRAVSQANQRADEEILGKILQTQKPELISSYVATAGLQDLRRLNAVLPPDVKQDISRNVLQDMITRARDPQTGTIAARDIASSLKKLGEGRARLIFGKQYEAVRDASALLNRINQSAQQSMIGRMHTARVMQGAQIAILGLAGLGGHFGAAAEVLGGELGFSWALAKTLTDPKKTAAALKILRLAAVSAARGIPYAGNEVFQTSPGQYPVNDFGVQLPAGGPQ